MVVTKQKGDPKMSFKSEVREFMAEMKVRTGARDILIDQIRQLRKHNEALMDRIMSHGLKDYKIQTMEFPDLKPPPSLGPDYDEDNAGEMLEGVE